VQILISESRDGEIIARIAAKLGLGSVRGSKTRGGARAVIEMTQLGREGYDLAITPDGPKGPRGSVAPGVLTLAARTELPIVPMGAWAEPCVRLHSWDRFLIPLPFARVAIAYGAPLRVEHRGEPRSEEEMVRRVEEALDAVERSAQKVVNAGFSAPELGRNPA
jgi:lysophospholipid acyltransferase (LPLAT)-like uncharacterized protein